MALNSIKKHKGNTMKNLILITAITLSSQLVSAQLDVNPVIGVGGGISMLDQDGIYAKTISFSPGIEINERSYFSLDFQYIKSHNKVACLESDTKLKGSMVSVSYAYRILNSNSKFSPMIGLTVGRGLSSNAKIRRTKAAPNYSLIPAVLEEHNFDTYGVFIRGKFMLDVRLKFISLRVGPTYSLFQAKRFVYEEQKMRSKGVSGIGLEAGIVIPLSKRIFSGNYHMPGRY